MHTPIDPMVVAHALNSEVVRRVTDADRRKLADLYRVHHRVIWRTLRRLGFSPESAADSTQQAYLIALERLDRIHEGSEKAFLFSTAIYFGRTAFRKEKRLELSEDIEVGSDLGEAAHRLDDRQMVLQLLDRVVSGMDPDLLTVFALYEIEGMTSPEISELLSIPLGTVASRLRRAREAFRQKVQQLEARSNSRLATLLTSPPAGNDLRGHPTPSTETDRAKEPAPGSPEKQS